MRFPDVLSIKPRSNQTFLFFFFSLFTYKTIMLSFWIFSDSTHEHVRKCFITGLKTLTGKWTTLVLIAENSELIKLNLKFKSGRKGIGLVSVEIRIGRWKRYRSFIDVWTFFIPNYLIFHSTHVIFRRDQTSPSGRQRRAAAPETLPVIRASYYIQIL